MFLAYGALSIAVIPYLLFKARFTDTPVDGIGIAVLLVMAAICLTPFGFFVRGTRIGRTVE